MCLVNTRVFLKESEHLFNFEFWYRALCMTFSQPFQRRYRYTFS